MNDEQQLTEQQSLELITRMISKAKEDYKETGVGALMWGSLVTFCSLVSFANFYIHARILNYIWFLTLAAVIPQIIISVRESKKKKIKTYNDDAMGGIWISFGISLFLLSIYANTFQSPHANTLFLIMYGIPTFATGFTRNFKPMIIGGIACWIFAVACIYINSPFDMLFSAAAAQMAWFIPGLILRRRCLNANTKNV
jgi:hypothetical protein